MLRRPLAWGSIGTASFLAALGCATTPLPSPSARPPAVLASADAARAPGAVPAPATTVQTVAFQSTTSEATTADHATATVAAGRQLTPPVSNVITVAEPIDPSMTLASPAEQAAQTVPINLPSTLAMIGGQHPVVGFARWRVQEAYAQLERAQVMWLPSIQSGFNYRRRDGNYQAVDGAIVDVNLNSLNYGLGAGAVAAGSPTEPGVVAEFHLADAIFLPRVAEKTAWARGHAASATLNQQLLEAAVGYFDLLEAFQDVQIIAEARRRTDEIAVLTKDFAEAGQGLQSDADRMAAELALVDTRALAAQERRLVASTRLARALSIPMTSHLQTLDSVIVPVELMDAEASEAALIATGLTARPELRESQALVAAACEAYQREKYAPFVPSVLLGFSTSSFGGGLGSQAENFAGRYDIDAMMVWQMRNLGLGEQAARRERRAQVQQATFTKLRVMDAVAQQVAEAHAQIGLRRQQVELSSEAIRRARDSYRRNVDRIRDGEGLPIEVLQSIQALETAERTYLQAVANYNRAQFQLQWALGWPVDAVAQGNLDGAQATGVGLTEAY